MAKSKAPDPKVQSLRSLGALNPHPDGSSFDLKAQMWL
jgi:hypothetical protein